MMQNHLAGQFLAVAAEKKEAPLFFDRRDGRWQAISYREVAGRVRALAASLAALGLQLGDRVILCAENSSSWAICDLAIMAAGGIVVPAYTPIRRVTMPTSWMIQAPASLFVQAAG